MNHIIYLLKLWCISLPLLLFNILKDKRLIDLDNSKLVNLYL